MKRDDAEAVALQALTWLTAEPSRLQAFIAETGATPDSVRRWAADPEFLAGVLDYLLADDSRVVDFTGTAEIDPTLPAAARQALPGAGQA